jgi:signal transduction histidine kinase
MNHMARELVHEIKLSLAGSDDDSPLGRVAKSLAEAGSEIDEIVRERSATDLATKSFLSIAKRLRENSFHVKDTALKLSKLKAFLAKNLRRPRNLDDWASIRVCSETAVAELKDQYPDSSRFISLAFGVEVEIRSSAELTTMVIRNLLRNALQARKYDVPAAISLSTDLRQDPNLELGLREANLRIVTKYGDSMTAERACNQIQSGLLGVPSSSEMGSGVGLDVARTVFVDLMGFSLSAVHEGCSAGLEITFRAAAGRVRVVEMSKVATA